MCRWTCINGYVRTSGYLLRLKVKRSHHSWSCLSSYFLRRDLSLGPGTNQGHKWAPEIHLSPLPSTRITRVCHYSWLFMWVLKIEFKFLWKPGKSPMELFPKLLKLKTLKRVGVFEVINISKKYMMPYAAIFIGKWEIIKAYTRLWELGANSGKRGRGEDLKRHIFKCLLALSVFPHFCTGKWEVSMHCTSLQKLWAQGVTNMPGWEYKMT